MATTETCVNHPGTETRVSCSTCGDPICPRCMRQAAVGQKCPSCARTPLRARALGRPRHYVRGIGAGLLAAALGGVALWQLVLLLPLSFLLGAALGFGVGKAVRWGVEGQTQAPFPAIAAVCGVAGVAVGYGLLGVLVPGVFALLTYAAAGYFAVVGLRA